MKKMEDNSVDLVLTDPPYGVRKKEEWDDYNNFLKNVNDWLNECFRISKNGVIWFCADQMMPHILKGRENQFHRLLIWNKPPGSQFNGASHNSIWYSMEPILIFKKNEELLKKGKEQKNGFAVINATTVPFATALTFCPM